MKLIGLTGTAGSGKDTVAEMITASLHRVFGMAASGGTDADPSGLTPELCGGEAVRYEFVVRRWRNYERPAAKSGGRK